MTMIKAMKNNVNTKQKSAFSQAVYIPCAEPGTSSALPS